MSEMFRTMWLDDQGQDLAEYAILLGIVLVVTVGVILLLGEDVNAIFGKADTAMKKVP